MAHYSQVQSHTHLQKAMSESAIIKQVPAQLAGMRLDAALAELFPDYSRGRVQQWIRDGNVRLDGIEVKPRTRLAGDEMLEVTIQHQPQVDEFSAQDIPLDIVYQDEDLIVVNKPAGLVVHPAAGHADGTLQNALLYFDRVLAEVPRAGIVHRLDRDTTGLLVVARNPGAHRRLVRLLQARRIKREYQALVHGVVTAGGSVDAAIGRHVRDRKRMCVREDGRPAVTHYRVLQRFRAHSHLLLELESGRTHQIRVHMQSIHHPLVGDPVYGGRDRIPAGADPAFINQLRAFPRQALHAWRLSLPHPRSGEDMCWEAPLPQDIRQLIDAMQADLHRAETSGSHD
jgi:23S rRNA pseudouridine1911/1915/1917 synthase